MAIKQYHSLKKNNLHLHVGHIFVGHSTTLVPMLEQEFKNMLCSRNACGICASCTAITAHQHPNIVWLAPEKYYTLDDMNIIKDRVSFLLEEHDHLFFVVQHADLLSNACSNSLLKTLEEPPRGYHFIFLTPYLEALLPTIRSRCVVSSRALQETVHKHPFLTYCTTLQGHTATDWLQLLEESEVNEIESAVIIDQALKHWRDQYKKDIACAEQKNIDKSGTLISFLERMQEMLPMAGSSKIFWRNFFLQFNNLSLH